MTKPAHALRKTEWDVQTVPLKVCQDLVAKYHYARRGSNTATFRHGLIYRPTGDVLGVAWWIPPTMSAAKRNYPKNPSAVLTLSRLCVAPSVPTNGASFLIGRSIALIRKDPRWECLLTYADEGYQGHAGTIYRATNWEYAGKTAAEPTWVDSSGRMVSRKAGPRTRTRAEMEALGYRKAGSHAKHRFIMLLHPAPAKQRHEAPSPSDVTQHQREEVSNGRPDP